MPAKLLLTACGMQGLDCGEPGSARHFQSVLSPEKLRNLNVQALTGTRQAGATGCSLSQHREDCDSAVRADRGGAVAE